MECPVINIWAVIVSTVAFWALGSLWYSPVLFGRTWQRVLKFSNEGLKRSNMFMIFGLSFLLMAMMVLGMAFILAVHKPEEVTWSSGLWLGITLAAVFSMTTMGISYLYQRRSFLLWLIDGFYMIFGLGMAGIILGAWH